MAKIEVGEYTAKQALRSTRFLEKEENQKRYGIL